METAERIMFILLCAFLFAGSGLLYLKNNAAVKTISVKRDAVKIRYTLEQVTEKLREENRIDINSASAKKLTELPGIGEKLAKRIIEYRETQGNFGVVEDIKNVRGIGEALLFKIKDRIKAR